MDTLPDEVLIKIFQYIPQHEIFSNVRLVNLKFNRVAQDQIFWKTITINLQNIHNLTIDKMICFAPNHVKKISLDYYTIKHELQPIIDAISQCKNLENYHILDIISVKQLMTIIESCREINNITVVNLVMPTSNIQFQTKLVELDLNCIQTHYLDHSKAQKILNEYVYFIKMLISNSPSLLHLCLSFDNLSVLEKPLFDKEMMKHVKLQTLVIKNMSISIKDISCFTPDGPGKDLKIVQIETRDYTVLQIFSKLENLTQLNVYYCTIPFVQLKSLLQYEFPKLKELSLYSLSNESKKDIEFLRNDITVNVDR
jgi:Leucine-rich repeat (LRR) protein